MNRLLFSITLLCLSCCFGWSVSFDQANQLFDQANEKSLESPSQAQELYQESIIQYQYLIDQDGKQSAPLYTNLANAYFMVGDQGRAVLNYHRALNIDPLLDDISHNLNYVRNLSTDELVLTKGQKVGRFLTFWHSWPFAVRCVLFAITFSLFWAVIARMLFQKNRWLYYSAAGLALVSLLFAGSLVVSHQAWDNTVDGVVLDREVIGRQGNGYIYDNAFTSSLHAGTEFTLLEQRGDWYHARLLDGSRCWLPIKATDLVIE